MYFTINRCMGRCPWKCIYCIGSNLHMITGRKKFAIHSPEWVEKQLNILLEFTNKIKQFSIVFHDNAWCSRNYLYKLYKYIKKNKLGEMVPKGFVESTPPILNNKVIEIMASTNVTKIDYGCESGSEKILKISKRKYTVAQMIDCVKKTSKKGLIPATWWLIGLPCETSIDVKRTLLAINKTIKIGGVPYWTTPIMVFPFTELYTNPLKYFTKIKFNSLTDYAKFSDMVKLNEKYITHETNYMSDKIMVRYNSLVKKYILKNSYGVLKIANEKKKNFIKKHPNFTEEMYLTYVKSMMSQSLKGLY